MRLTTRAQPPEDSPAPGVIPGAVHVHDEPDHRERPMRVSETATQPRASRAPRRWQLRRGHRS